MPDHAKKNKNLIQALRLIENMELCSIYDPENTHNAIKVGSNDIPVFQKLETFLREGCFDFLIDEINISKISQALSKSSMDKTTVISKEQLAFFKPLLEKLNEAVRVNKQSEAITEAAQEGIQVVDANGKILYANSSFVCITKVPLEERINKNVFDVSPDGSLAEVLRTGRAVLGNTHVTRGTPVIANAFPLITDGKLTGAVTVFSDASSVEKLAHIIHREEVNSLKEAIHRMNQAKYSFKDLIGKSPIFTKCLSQAKLAGRC